MDEWIGIRFVKHAYEKFLSVWKLLKHMRASQTYENFLNIYGKKKKGKKEGKKRREKKKGKKEGKKEGKEKKGGGKGEKKEGKKREKKERGGKSRWEKEGGKSNDQISLDIDQFLPKRRILDAQAAAQITSGTGKAMHNPS